MANRKVRQQTLKEVVELLSQARDAPDQAKFIDIGLDLLELGASVRHERARRAHNSAAIRWRWNRTVKDKLDGMSVERLAKELSKCGWTISKSRLTAWVKAAIDSNEYYKDRSRSVQSYGKTSHGRKRRR